MFRHTIERSFPPVLHVDGMIPGRIIAPFRSTQYPAVPSHVSAYIESSTARQADAAPTFKLAGPLTTSCLRCTTPYNRLQDVSGSGAL